MLFDFQNLRREVPVNCVKIACQRYVSLRELAVNFKRSVGSRRVRMHGALHETVLRYKTSNCLTTDRPRRPTLAHSSGPMPERGGK